MTVEISVFWIRTDFKIVELSMVDRNVCVFRVKIGRCCTWPKGRAYCLTFKLLPPNPLTPGMRLDLLNPLFRPQAAFKLLMQKL
jgi:hypothetical protein